MSNSDGLSDYAVSNIEQLDEIKRLYNIGDITREEAYDRAKPLMDAIDARGREIAKKHKRKYRPLVFASLMR